MALKTNDVKPTKKTKREIEEEDEDEDEDLEDDDDDVEEDEDDDDLELDLDLDVDFGAATDFEAIAAGTYPAVVLSETKNGSLPEVRKVAYGDHAGEKGVNFGFKIVGSGKNSGRVLWKEVPIKLVDKTGRSILSMTVIAILGKGAKSASLAEALEECQDQPVYIRVVKKFSKKNEKWYNNVSFVMPADEKHPVNSGEMDEEDDD